MSETKVKKEYKTRGFNAWETKVYNKLRPELEKIDYKKEIDESILCLFLRHLWYVEECKKIVENEGLIICNPAKKNQPMQHPAYQTMRQNSEAALRCAKALGITAIGRKAIGIALEEVLDDSDLTFEA
jgi:P27 family predicted phage terminase small subunit